MSAELPVELIFEIFLLLPVLTLVQLKVVSKQWRTLIDNPNFQKAHFNYHSMNKPHDSKKFMVFPYNKQDANYFDLYSLWQCTSKKSDFVVMENKISYPTNIRIAFICPLSPVYGVLGLITVTGDALLWNPFIRKHLCIKRPVLPHKKHYLCGNERSMWSLGYDSRLDDYVLVFVTRFVDINDGRFRFPVWVYSVKVGSWKSIGDMPYSLCSFSHTGAFVNGALHWPGYERKAISVGLIISLDLQNLEYTLVPRPKCLDDPWSVMNRGFGIGVLDGCLYFNSFVYGSPVFDLWVMKDYGVRESWTRLISSTCCNPTLTTLAYVKNDKKLLFVNTSNSLVWYDFDDRSCKTVIHYSLPPLSFPIVYTPSLVFPAAQSDAVCPNK